MTISEKFSARRCRGVAQVVGLLALLVGCTGAEVPVPSHGPQAAMPDRKAMPDGSWARVLATVVALRAREDLPQATVDVQVNGRHPWIVEGVEGDGSHRAVVVLSFRDKDSPDLVARYLFSPWQRLHWAGNSANQPSLVSVNHHGIVFALPPDDGAAEHRAGIKSQVFERSAELVSSVSGPPELNDGIQIGRHFSILASDGLTSTETLSPGESRTEPSDPVYKLCPYYLRVDQYRAFSHPYTNPGNWDSVVEERMAVIVSHGPEEQVHVSCFPPAQINRQTPTPFDPAEQRLAPGTDLTLAGKVLNQEIIAIFQRTADEALHASGAEQRQRILSEALPDLERAVYAYPGHSGPAHAAGAAALDRWRGRLSRLVLGNSLWLDRDYWPASLISYRPELIPVLRGLPEAVPSNLSSLCEEFRRYSTVAAREPGHAAGEVGSWSPTKAELLAAELGDRIRTANTANPDKGGPSSYKRFRFEISHPLRGEARRQAKGPFKVQLRHLR